MTELFDLYNRLRRSRKEPKQIAQVIEADGGEIIEYRHVSRLVPSPFKGIRILPLLYEFRVHYNQRRGVWWVRTARDSDSRDWVWFDDDGNISLPGDISGVVSTEPAKVVGWMTDTVVLLSMILLGILLATIIYIFIL